MALQYFVITSLMCEPKSLCDHEFDSIPGGLDEVISCYEEV